MNGWLTPEEVQDKLLLKKTEGETAVLGLPGKWPLKQREGGEVVVVNSGKCGN